MFVNHNLSFRVNLKNSKFLLQKKTDQGVVDPLPSYKSCFIIGSQKINV